MTTPKIALYLPQQRRELMKVMDKYPNEKDA